MTATKALQLNWIEKERNIYEAAQLYPQCRKPIADYLHLLAVPGTDKALRVQNEFLVGEQEEKFAASENIANFIAQPDQLSEWGKLNQQFLNYHKSLTIYTLLNSTPIINYLGLASGMASIQNKVVIDVGGGTGHTLCSFFHHPEGIEYYLVDPNVREVHDHLLRVYPKLGWLQMGHLVAYAEKLPFKSNSADVVMTLSAIDHFKDYEAFIQEAYRVLKPGGQIFISSHLDIPAPPSDQTKTSTKIFSHSFWERVARYLYFRKYRVGHDDHTFHFTDTKPFEDAMKKAGFVVERSEIFKRYFYVLGRKAI